MSTPEDQPAAPAASPEERAGFTWRKLAVWAAYAIPVIFILLMVLFQEFIPFLVTFIVVFALLGFWASRGGRASVIVLGVIAVIFILMNLPFIIPTLMVPASILDFVSTAWILLAAITVIVAAFVAFRGAGRPEGARKFAQVMGTLAALVLIVSLVAGFTYSDASRQEGDIEIVTEDIEFHPDEIEAESGTISVFITNNDPTLHTFTIDELDVDVDIPANATARVEFEADAGEYRFYCEPHQPDMDGTLQVR